MQVLGQARRGMSKARNMVRLGVARSGAAGREHGKSEARARNEAWLGDARLGWSKVESRIRAVKSVSDNGLLEFG